MKNVVKKHEPLHRDDIDAEMVAEIEKQFQELYPGFKVQFAGDTPGGVPPEQQAAIDQIDQLAAQSIIDGTCVDCGCQMPDYQPDHKGWQPAEGWSLFHDIKTDEPRAWQCPECNEAEQDGVPRPINIREEP